MSLILITGANRGIGLALTDELLMTGHRVVATCRNIETAADLHKLRLRHGTALDIQPLDVTSEQSVLKLAEHIGSQYKSLDVLVNNAAVFVDRKNTSIVNLDLQQLLTTFATNVGGVARVTKALWPMLRNGNNPRVVNLSSGAGLIATKRNSKYYAYSISKAALNMFTRLLETEGRAQSICVVAVTPGRVQTEMGDQDAPLTAQACAQSLAKMLEQLEITDTGRILDRNGLPCFEGVFTDSTGGGCPVGW